MPCRGSISWGRCFGSCLSGIRIRFGRSLVTVSGVVLGIAFLMSNLTGQLIKQSIAKESAERNTVNLMQSLVQSEIGDVAGRNLAAPPQVSRYNSTAS